MALNDFNVLLCDRFRSCPSLLPVGFTFIYICLDHPSPRNFFLSSSDSGPFTVLKYFKAWLLSKKTWIFSIWSKFYFSWQHCSRPYTPPWASLVSSPSSGDPSAVTSPPSASSTQSYFTPASSHSNNPFWTGLKAKIQFYDFQNTRTPGATSGLSLLPFLVVYHVGPIHFPCSHMSAPVKKKAKLKFWTVLFIMKDPVF